MAKIKFPRKEFEKHIKLTKEIEEKISMLGTPLESLTNEEIEVEIFPNRPDLLSLQGYLRALKAFIGKETGLKRYRVNSPEKDYKVTISPSVKSIRPFTACAIIKGLQFDDSKIKEIVDIQEKLHATVGRNRKKIAIGIYPLDKITLPIKYEARFPKDIKFIPLEADKEMNGLEILQRHPAGREYSPLLEGKEKFPVFVDAKGKILSMPPIINSRETGKITENTKDIFIECSGFDFSVLKKTLNIIVTTLADLGGRVYAMTLDYGKKETTPDLTPEKMKISLENTNNLLGLDLKEKDLEKLLPKMGYEYKKPNILIPAWRTDILHEVDIIEDIAIAYGYDKLIPEVPKLATIGEESKESKVERKIAEILAGLGLLETSSYQLIKAEEAKTAKIQESEQIVLEESKTEYKILRPNLLIPALRVFSENKDNEYPQKIFELGTVFQKDSGDSTETGIKESEHLIVALCPGNFTSIKQILEYLGKMLDVQFHLKDSSNNLLIEGRTGSIFLDNNQIGYIGELHPEALRAFSIKMPVSVIEISLNKLFSRF